MGYRNIEILYPYPYPYPYRIHKTFFLWGKLKPDLVSGFSSALYRYPNPYRIHAFEAKGKEPGLVSVFRNFYLLFFYRKLTVGPVPVPTFLFSRFGSAFVSISRLSVVMHKFYGYINLPLRGGVSRS